MNFNEVINIGDFYNLEGQKEKTKREVNSVIRKPSPTRIENSFSRIKSEEALDLDLIENSRQTKSITNNIIRSYNNLIDINNFNSNQKAKKNEYDMMSDLDNQSDVELKLQSEMEIPFDVSLGNKNNARKNRRNSRRRKMSYDGRRQSNFN